jgi:hypothetical protein
MKSAILLAIAIVTFSSLPVVSRRDAAAQESFSSKADANGAHANQSGAHLQPGNSIPSRPADTELPRTIGSKTGNPDQPKTKNKVGAAQGAQIHKGPRSMSRPVSVQGDAGLSTSSK